MGQRLAGGGRVGRSLARGREVGQLGGGLLVLVLDLLGDGACGEAEALVQSRTEANASKLPPPATES